MTGSKLKLNPSKREFLLIGTKLQREQFLNNFSCLLLALSRCLTESITAHRVMIYRALDKLSTVY